MPPRGLPGNANLEQLKKGAKSFQRAVRAGDVGAGEVVREFHPRLPDAQPGSAELERFTRADAQLVIARQFAFASWPKLKAHLELVERYARSPHEQPIGGPLADERAIVDEFLRLACLTYGDDDTDRLSSAQSLLEEHDWLSRASIHTIAATGDLDAAREALDRDPARASLLGGPHRWEPLLYLTYSRVPLAPERSAVAVARLLLEHGADPNAGYLWEGLCPPFTALTGVLGAGGIIPMHAERLALARLLLEAGADPNDGQALYNQGWGPDPREDWLELLFEFGLGIGDGGPWRRLLGERQDSPKEMVEDLLMAAASHGLTDRVRRLLARSVNPEGRGSRHPIYQGRSPAQQAALSGHMDVVSTLVDAGASWEHDAVDALVAAAMAGDRDTVDRLLAADPGLRERATQRRPDQLVTAAEQSSHDAVGLLIELGFDVNARPRTAPLHEAGMRGNLEIIRLLLDHGADPNLHDTAYDATPAGWAEHHGQHEAQQLLEALEHADAGTAQTDREDDAIAERPMGAAMRTVTAAFTAVSGAQFDEFASLLSPEIEWRGLADEDGHIARCHGRREALEVMRAGLVASGQVSVSAFVEDGNRVLAHVHPDGGEVGERFLVAEAHDGQITHLAAYATEPEARAALHDEPAATASVDRPASRTAQREPTDRTDPLVLTLRPLTQADLPEVRAWFEDADTQQFLGGPDWPAAMLATANRSIGTMFRGATQTGAHHYLALAADTPIGYIDCGTFDRCTVYAGEGPEGPIIPETIEAVTGSIAFVIDPARRRQGLATAMIRALTRHPRSRTHRDLRGRRRTGQPRRPRRAPRRWIPLALHGAGLRRDALLPSLVDRAIASMSP